MVEMEHVELAGLFLPAPMLLVFGATIGCGIASTTLKDAIASFKAVPKAFTGKVTPPQSVIDDVVGLAETARSNGLLALEQEADKHDDPFMKKALQNIADGTDGDELRILLEDEIESNAAPTRSASAFFMGLGGFAPTVGIIGTVVSLTHVLANLGKPDELRTADRQRVRRHPVGPAHRELHVAADRRQAPEARAARVGPADAPDGGPARGPGRQPAPVAR